MLKLYGFAVSNYFNMVKHALLEKGVEFEEVTVFPEQSSEHLARSPMGKIPCIETEQGFLCETSIILDYIEAQYPDRPLMPADPWQQAKIREAMKVAELYIELPARKLLPAVFMGVDLSETVKTESRALIEKGLRAIDALCEFSPYALGAEQTLADIMLRYTLVLAKFCVGPVLGWNFLDENPRLKQWDEMMGQNPICQQLDRGMMESMEAFQKRVAGKK